MAIPPEKFQEAAESLKPILEEFGKLYVEKFGIKFITHCKAQAKAKRAAAAAGPPREPRKIDPKKLLKASPKMSGTLEKKDRKRGWKSTKWRERHLAIEDAKLVYREKESKGKAKEVPVTPTSCVSPGSWEGKGKKNTFEVSDPASPAARVYVFECESPEVQKTWISAVKQTILLQQEVAAASGGAPAKDQAVITIMNSSFFDTWPTIVENHGVPAADPKLAPKGAVTAALNEKVMGSLEEALQEGLEPIPEAMGAKEKAEKTSRDLILKTVTTAVDAAWEVLEKGIEEAVTALKEQLDKAMEQVFEVEAQIKAKISELAKAVIDPLLEKMSPPLGKAIGLFLEPIGKVYVPVCAKAGEMEDQIQACVDRDEFDKIDKIVSEAHSTIGATFQKIPEFCKEIKGKLEEVKKLLAGLEDQVDIDALPVDSIIAAVEGCVEPISNAIEKSTEKVTGLVDKVKKYEKKGIEEATTKLSEKIDGVATTVIMEIKSATTPAKASVAEGLAGAPEEIRTALTSFLDAFIDIPDRCLGDLKEEFKRSMTELAAKLGDAKEQEAITKVIRKAFVNSVKLAYRNLKAAVTGAVSRLFSALTTGLIVPKVKALVLPPIKDGMAPLSDSIPEAVKKFIDPVDILTEWIIETIMFLIDTVLGPFQKLLDETIGKAVAAATTGDQSKVEGGAAAATDKAVAAAAAAAPAAAAAATGAGAAAVDEKPKAEEGEKKKEEKEGKAEEGEKKEEKAEEKKEDKAEEGEKEEKAEEKKEAEAKAEEGEKEGEKAEEGKKEDEEKKEGEEKKEEAKEAVKEASEGEKGEPAAEVETSEAPPPATDA